MVPPPNTKSCKMQKKYELMRLIWVVRCSSPNAPKAERNPSGSHSGEESIWLHNGLLPCGREDSVCLHHLYLSKVQGEINSNFLGSHCGEELVWLHHACLCGVTKVGWNRYGSIILAFSGSPKLGRIDMVAWPLPFRGPQNGQESIYLHNPCRLRVTIAWRNIFA